MSFEEFTWSLAITASQPLSGDVRLVGKTHASRVICVRCSDAESGMLTIEPTAPVNFRPDPYLPAAQVVLAATPLLPVPLASATVVPAFSSSEYAATREAASSRRASS